MSPCAVSPLQLLTGHHWTQLQSTRLVTFGPPAPTSGPGDLALVVGLNDVAVLEVLEVREPDAALEARRDLAHIVLEAAQRVDGALPNDGALAQEADLRAAGDLAVAHVTPGHGADPGHPEHLAHLGLARDDLLVDRREQSEHGRLDVLEQLVDDLVGPDLDVGRLGQLTRALVGAHVDPDDGGIGGGRELHVVLGEAPDAAEDEAELHVLALEPLEAFGDG